MLNVIPFAHKLMTEVIEPGDFVVDATCGNGNDTLFLSRLVGKSGHIFAVDIQEEAILATKNLLGANHTYQITFIHDNHANINQYLPANRKGSIAAAIFNLGYLPGGDKAIITQPETTIPAVEQLLNYVRPGGRVVLVIYSGHLGGQQENDAILSFATGLDQTKYTVLQYQFINQKNHPPFVIAIEKRQTKITEQM